MLNWLHVVLSLAIIKYKGRESHLVSFLHITMWTSNILAQKNSVEHQINTNEGSIKFNQVGLWLFSEERCFNNKGV